MLSNQTLTFSVCGLVVVAYSRSVRAISCVLLLLLLKAVSLNRNNKDKK